MPVLHIFESAVPDSADTSLVRPSDWNDEHKATGGTDGNVLQRDSTVPDTGMKWTDTPICQAVRFLLTAPASPESGDAWFEASGVSPNRTMKLFIRDGSTSIEVISIGPY